MNDSLTCATCRVRSRVCEHVEANIKAAIGRAESQGFHEGTRDASAELLRLQDEVEHLRGERDAWRGLCEASPQYIERAFATLISFYRDDERRDIAAWLQYQGEKLNEQGESEVADGYITAASQVAKGAKMIGPGAATLSAKALRTTDAQPKEKT